MKAFVILPFEEHFEELYEEMVAPILEDEGYEVNKADSLDSQRAILQDIIRGINGADLLIADLTGSNPNVFYELGIAHGLGVPTVLISQDISELPFDLNAYKTIEYSPHFSKIEKLEEELSDIAESHSNGNIDFGNPVSDFGDVEIGRIRTKDEEDSETPEVSESSEEADSEEADSGEAPPEMGVLEFASEVDDRMAEFEKIANEISTESNEFETEIIERTNEIQQVSTANSGHSHKKVNRIARDIADSLSSYSEFIDERIEPIEEQLTFIMDGIQSFISFSDITRDDHREVLADIQNDLGEFKRNMTRNSEELKAFQKETTGMKGLNRELDKAVNNLNNSLSSLESIFEEAAAKSERYETLIENGFEEWDSESGE